jgi:DNA-binding MarR family transcriptional regulator
MQQQIVLDLLETIANATYTTRELVNASPYSPATVVRYLKELERQGFIKRQKAERVRPGRSAIINLPTLSGLEMLRTGELGVFRKLAKDVGALWGPRRTFAHQGIPFFGRPDLFAKSRVQATPFDVIVERRGWLYKEPILHGENRFPALEPFLAWVAGTENPRFLAACAVLLKRGDVNGRALADVAETAGTVNRLGYLAAIVDAREVLEHLKPHRRSERMLPSQAPVDRRSARFASQWNVKNPLSASTVTDLWELYGNE